MKDTAIARAAPLLEQIEAILASEPPKIRAVVIAALHIRHEQAYPRGFLAWVKRMGKPNAWQE